jgi:hypothetical protein
MAVVRNVPDIVIWAPVVTAFIALLAAGAAWWTARVTSRAYRRSQLPDLHVLFIRQQQGPLSMVVRNLGNAPAKASSVVLVVKDQAMQAFVPDTGFLDSGHGYKLHTTIPADGLEKGDYMAVVSCRDVNGLYHGWSSMDEHREYRDWLRRPRQKIDIGDDVFQSFFPGVDPVGRNSLRYRLELLEP